MFRLLSIFGVIFALGVSYSYPNCTLKRKENDSFILNCSNLGLQAYTSDLFQHFKNLSDSKYSTSGNESFSIDSVDFSNNSLTIFTEDSLSSLYNLKALNLSYNQLKNVNFTDWSLLPNLTTLDLSHNLELGKSKQLGAFIEAMSGSSVAHLNLSSIGFHTVAENTFKKSTNLLQLDLSNNCIKTMPNLPKNLESLDFSRNCISHIDPRYFVLDTRLKVLLLEFNIFLKDVHFGSLNFLKDLRNISFHGCRELSHLPVALFFNNKKLTSLNLSSCNFTSISVSFKESFEKVNSIDLRNNPWHCSTNITWFKNLQTSGSLKYSEDLRCASPKNITLKDYLDPAVGSHMVRLLITVISVILFCLLITAVAYGCNLEKKRREIQMSYSPLERSKNPYDRSIYVTTSV